MKYLVTLLFAFGLVAGGLTYKDARTSLIIHYPKGWRIDHDASLFMIVNFPERDRPPQLLVPAGKAMIMIDAPPVHSMDELIRYNQLTEANGYQREETMINTSAGRISGERFTLDHDRFIPEAHKIVDAFVVRGRVYDTSLFYRGGAATKAEYEKIYRDIVSAIQFPA